MKHTLAIAQYVILGCFLLLFTLIALDVLKPPFVGKATSGSTVNILESVPMNCSFNPGEGYNIVSFPCVTTEYLDNLTTGTQVVAIYQYIPNTADLWRVYNPNLPSYVVSDLQYVTRRNGYVVIMNASANKLIYGIHVAQTDVPFVSGWNLVGYPSNISTNATAGFAGLGNYTRIVTYNKSSEAFVSYPSGGLVDTISGEGYWVNATASTTWTVSS